MDKINKRKGARDESWREKIQAGVIMDRLIKHVFGEIEMSNTQVKAAQILLAKVIPDLKSVENTGLITHHYVMALPQTELSAEEWQRKSTANQQTLQ